MMDDGLDPRINPQTLRDLLRMTDDQRREALQPVARLVPKNPAPKDETVVEFLRDLLGRVERGEVDLSEGFVIHYLSSGGPRSTDGCTHHYWRHGMGMFAHLGLLAIASRDVIENELLK